MSDRHKYGDGKIIVEKRIISDYLKIIGKSELPKSEYELTEVETEIPVQRINEIENEKIKPTEFDGDLHFKNPNELTNEEIEFVIAELIEDEKNVQYNKIGRAHV